MRTRLRYARMTAGEGEWSPGQVKVVLGLVALVVLAIAAGLVLSVGHVARGTAPSRDEARTSAVVTTATALANAMMGHVDETDDSHLAGMFHPGCGIVPAALAVAEQAGLGGEDLIRAVALGYDVGARIAPALGSRRSDTGSHSTHSYTAGT